MSTTTRPGICRICSAQRGVLATVVDGKLPKVTGDPDNPLFKGYTCAKGRALHEIHNNPDRLLHSQKRTVDGRYAPIESGQAMDEIAVALPCASPRDPKEGVDMTNVVAREPNLVNPWAPHRVRMYLGAALFTGLVFVGMTIGVGVGLIEPTFTSDVIANLLFGIPAILIPLVLLWDAPGEHRMREEKAAELTLFYLPYTAFSQICYELVFLIGHPLGWWTPTTDPGVKWLWWQYGLADTRYASGNPWTFALEVVGVSTGIVVIIMWTRLVRQSLPIEKRIRSLWVAFAGIAILMSSTAVYFISEVGAGFNDIGQGAFGLWFKFIGENIPFIVMPAMVLYAIHIQIDYLTRKVAVSGSGR